MKTIKHWIGRIKRSGVAVITATALVVTSLGQSQAAQDQTVFFFTDATGSPMAAFNEQGDICWSESYGPYGEKLDNEDAIAEPARGCGLLGTDVGYTGHVQDGSGLVYAQQRYYDPAIGRFLSTDPITPSSGSPNMFGRYHYANNSPYKFTDPTGMIADNWAVKGHEEYSCSTCDSAAEGRMREHIHDAHMMGLRSGNPDVFDANYNLRNIGIDVVVDAENLEIIVIEDQKYTKDGKKQYTGAVLNGYPTHGRVSLSLEKDGSFSINDEEYNFDQQERASSVRNGATAIGGFVASGSTDAGGNSFGMSYQGAPSVSDPFGIVQ